MKRFFSLHYTSRFYKAVLEKETSPNILAETTGAIVSKKKEAINIKKALKENALQSFVQDLETREVNERDLSTITHFFRLWNKSVVSKTSETKSAAIHELMMLIANCDQKIKMETNYILDLQTGKAQERAKGAVDYALFQISWPYPFVTYEADSDWDLSVMKRLAIACNAISLRYSFPRSYGLCTNLDKWIFFMHNNDPAATNKLKTYTHTLDLSDNSNLQANLEELMKKSDAFIRNAFTEYRNIKRGIRYEQSDDEN